MIASDDLHAAADIVGVDSEPPPIEDYGLPLAELEQFINGSHWRDCDAHGPLRELDPLTLAIGISIGIVAKSRETAGLASDAQV